jgi:hypothetical protein
MAYWAYVLTLFDIGLLLNKVLDDLFFLNAFFLLAGFLDLLRLRGLIVFKHAEVVSQAVEVAPERFALALLNLWCELKRRSKPL